MQLASVDRRLLNLIQTEFPLTREPYAELGRRLGTDANEVMQRIARLMSQRVIRLIGPVMDSRSIGYQTTLVAMRIAETQLGKAEQIIADHPGISHGYERDHNFNVWFTLAVPSNIDIEHELDELTRSTCAEAAFPLPAIKVFKIGAYFDMDEDGQKTTMSRRSNALAQKVELSSTERLTINMLQQSLPLTPTPFNAIAEQVGIDVEQFLAQCRSLQQRGVIRRFSASINHYHAGFSANGMACWAVPLDTIDVMGQKLALLKEVSHCYQRKTNPLWGYNLFAMIHCRSRELCHQIAAKVSQETALINYVMLFGTKEFKKTRISYLV
jgi:DNA-binding Lrp family transcriptional regulator